MNRDLERRLAARRQRERRRSGQGLPNRSLLSPTAPAPEDGAAEDRHLTRAEVIRAPAAPVARAARAERAAPIRPAPRPFTAYRDEYAYVFADLRRIVLVAGGLLVLLIVLAFVLRV